MVREKLLVLVLPPPRAVTVILWASAGVEAVVLIVNVLDFK
jgi:hypothetical protein